jgi:hypothetical protein
MRAKDFLGVDSRRKQESDNLSIEAISSYGTQRFYKQESTFSNPNNQTHPTLGSRLGNMPETDWNILREMKRCRLGYVIEIVTVK